MQDGFGSGGFNIGGSSKSNVDNYYTYKQTSGGGGNGGGGNSGCLTGIISIGIVLLLAVLFVSN